MKNKLALFLISLFTISLQSCQVVGGIFKAGVWVGVVAVVGVIGLIVFLIGKGSK